MKKFALACLVIALVACKEEKPSLQEYFVNSESKKEFLNADVSSSILNLDPKLLSSEEKKALESFEKVNILAFKKDDKNANLYKKEIEEVKEILKDSAYEPLIKMNGVGHNASVMLVGNENAIDELVLFGNQKDMGFTVIRILGDNMKPENAVTFLNILQKSKIDTEQLTPILNFINKDNKNTATKKATEK